MGMLYRVTQMKSSGLLDCLIVLSKNGRILSKKRKVKPISMKWVCMMKETFGYEFPTHLPTCIHAH